MTRVFASLLALVFAAPAMAQTVEDSDGSGGFSVEELTAAFPDLTSEMFAMIDADASGEVDADELAAAQNAGLLPG